MLKYTYEDLQRFWSHVNIRDPEECWEWQRSVDNKGYGKFSIRHKHIYAHRFSYWIYNNTFPILNVCHSCDNPKCCNPKHLWLGTQKDNIQDAIKKGRHSNPPVHWNNIINAKLSIEQVIEIKKAFKNNPKTSYSSLVNLYGVSRFQIRLIRIGKSWKHVSL